MLNIDRDTGPEATPGTRAGVTPGRRRLGLIMIPVVLLVLAFTVWQTWDYWGPQHDETEGLPAAAGPGSNMPRAVPGSMPSSGPTTAPAPDADQK